MCLFVCVTQNDKYSIVSSATVNQHNNLAQLIEFYKTNPIELGSGEQCLLGEVGSALTKPCVRDMQSVEKKLETIQSYNG